MIEGIDLIALAVRARQARTPAARLRAAREVEAAIAEWRRQHGAERCPHCGYKRRRRRADMLEGA